MTSNSENLIAARFVWCFHMAFVSYIFLTPLVAPWIFLPGHICMCILVMGHWITNDNTCALSIIEAKLRGIDQQSSFFYSVVEPIYSKGRIGRSQESLEEVLVIICWIVLIFLVAISIYRLSKIPELGKKCQIVYRYCAEKLGIG